MMNKIRNYSTNINSQGLLNSHKINVNKTIYILSPLEISNAFCNELDEVLSSLEPNKKYKLEFCMALYTNKKKQFIPTYPGMNDLFNDYNKGYYRGQILMLEQFVYSKYKFKGYISLLNNTVNINDLDDPAKMAEFVFETYRYLKHKINDTNVLFQEYYDFQRPFVLIINKI